LSISQVASFLTKLTPDFRVDTLNVPSTDPTYGLPAATPHERFVWNGAPLQVIVDFVMRRIAIATGRSRRCGRRVICGRTFF
jgi:hypothetical protein